MVIYEEYDCETREEYLEYLADHYDVDLEHVIALADVLGPNEDFDGLVSAFEMVG